MINLENIKEIKFSYYDVNKYVYDFIMLENRKEKISQNEYRFYLICLNTNVSANGEVFLNLKIKDDKLYFRTDYFANSFDDILLNKKEKTSNASDTFFVDFGEDLLEIKVSYE
ncbi:MAG: hypothetical protein ACERKK_05645 [Poseidonibacter sp.]|uniref:hypothetical protein n=1 Tax=Poseidonibacter sp. TaxID=2321188 RepID=UPI00359E52BE